MARPLALAALIAFTASAALAQAPPNSPRFAVLQAVEQVADDSGDAALDAFIANHVHPDFLAEAGRDGIAQIVSRIRAAAGMAGGIEAAPLPNGARLTYLGPQTVTVDLGLTDDFRIRSIDINEAQSDPNSPDAMVRTRIRGIESLGRQRSPQALARFKAEHLSPALAESIDSAMLEEIGVAFSRAGGINVRQTADGMQIILEGAGGAMEINFTLSDGPPYHITELSTAETAPRERATVAPLSWDGLEDQLAEHAANGFSGVVLVRRGGETVLHRAYGMADVERGVAQFTDTVFGIGSTPIDFTRASILMLIEDGRLRWDQPISTLLTEVPGDREGMTIAHLMTGRSGLPNYHHNDTDADPDLSWIDRDEAVRRMMGTDLLFAPGDGEAHSHSAYVLLAAIIEMVSGVSYGDFLRDRILGPAEMTSTGFYGADSGIEAERMASGYGPSSVGSPNIPANWGPTSWLMMGAGGMVSTAEDLARFNAFLEHELEQESRDRFFVYPVTVGGSDRGFFTLQARYPDAEVYLLSNREGDLAQAVGRALAALAAGS